MDFEEHTLEIKNLNDLKSDEVLEEEEKTENEGQEEIIEELEVKEENVAEETSDEIQEEKKEKEKKPFKEKIKKLKEKWASLPKKKKILIIVLTILILLAIVIGIIFFVKGKKSESPNNVPDVILEEENYRYENGKLIFLNKNGKEIGEYLCEHQDQETCYVAFYSSEDSFDEPKLVYEDNERIKTRSEIVLDQYAFVYDNQEKEDGKIKLYDFKNEKEIEEYYLVKAYPSLKNKFIVKDTKDKYYLIEISEEKVNLALNSSYDYLGFIDSIENNNILVSKRDNSWYLTDFTDNTLTKAITNPIKYHKNNVIKTIDEEGKYHIIDYNGADLRDESYDYIDLLDSYVLFIKNNELFVEDYRGNKMHEEAIVLKNDHYIPTGIYSKSNKLIKTEKSYDISFQGSSMVVEIFIDTTNSEKTTINLNEGKISSNISYMNYFGGKLYIYKEEEKKSLLGTYQCENKNQITDETTTLTNCTIATESFYEDNDIEINQSENLGILPIYNERYLFIQDSSNPSNDPNIVLYDLKESTTKTKYKSVDAGSYKKENKISFVSANNTHIIAENKSGKFGIIRINSSSVEGVKEFNYNHIERVGLYYIVQDENGYALMDHTGNILSSGITNKIRNFDLDTGYITAKNNDSKYYLYQLNGKKVTEMGYDYISLYNNYFGAVKESELSFYRYDDPDKKSGESVKLKHNHYYGNNNLAYTADIVGTTANVKVGNGTSYDTIQISLIEKTTEDDANEQE